MNKNTHPDTPFSPLGWKRLQIEQPLCALYRHFIPPTPLHITLLTYIHPDGLGDFGIQQEAARALSRTLLVPHSLSLLSLHPKSLSLTPPSLPYRFTPLALDDKGRLPLNLLLPSLESTDVLLELPTCFPQTPELLRLLLSRQPLSYELLGEGGWGKTPHFSPERGARALGFHPWERGIFFPSIGESDSLPSSLPLRPEDILCLGYLRNPKAGIHLLQTLLIQKKEDPSPLTLVLFPCEGVIQALPSLTLFLANQGISKVEVYYGEHQSNLPIQTKGKLVKIVSIPKLAQSTYHSLLRRSQSLVGCRGDSSLAELLLLGKIPFFDLPAHKTPLLEGLIEAAKDFLPPQHETLRYLSLFLSPCLDVEIAGALAKDPATEEGCKTLSLFLQEHYRADHFLHDLTMRAACHRYHPEIAFLEGVLLQPFLENRQSSSETLSRLKSMLFA